MSTRIPNIFFPYYPIILYVKIYYNWVNAFYANFIIWVISGCLFCHLFPLTGPYITFLLKSIYLFYYFILDTEYDMSKRCWFDYYPLKRDDYLTVPWNHTWYEMLICCIKTKNISIFYMWIFINLNMYIIIFQTTVALQ